MASARPRDWKLRNKVIFHILIIGLLAGIVLSFILWGSLRAALRISNSREMALLGTIFEDHIQLSLSQGSVSAVRTSLEHIIMAGKVERVRILDTSGGVLHSVPDEVSPGLTPWERRRLEGALRGPWRQGRTDVNMIAIDRGFLPLVNKPGCRRCHPGGERYLGFLDVTFALSEEFRTLKEARDPAIVIAVLTLAVMALVTYRLYARIIDRPLARLMNSMRRIESGDLSPRLDPARRDEFGTLARSFNSMAEHLEAAGREVARHHERQIEKAGHLASLGELAAGLAHEIRNPIAGIKGVAEIIIDQSAPDDPRREVLGEVRRQADKIHSVVQNLLHYARPRELERKRQNPSLCVQSAISMAEHQLEGRDISLRFHRPEDEIEAEIDCDKIQEVVLNLLLNAMAAVGRRGEISVVMGKDGEQLEIRVEDDGPGIPPENMPLIFNPFFTTRKKGTGLGLSLCRQIVELHGGTITARSDPGRRTVFTVRLPLAGGDLSG